MPEFDGENHKLQFKNKNCYLFQNDIMTKREPQ